MLGGAVIRTFTVKDDATTLVLVPKLEYHHHTFVGEYSHMYIYSSAGSFISRTPP